jgi:hypothetical protein
MSKEVSGDDMDPAKERAVLVRVAEMEAAMNDAVPTSEGREFMFLHAFSELHARRFTSYRRMIALLQDTVPGASCDIADKMDELVAAAAAERAKVVKAAVHARDAIMDRLVRF